MIKRFVLVLAAVAAPAVLFAGSASAATHHHKAHTFAACSARGGYAICDASGTVNHPSSLWVHVRAKPQQQVSGAWDVVCSKGSGVGDKSGTFTGKAAPTITRRMKMNYRHPDQCTVSADAQLSKNGSSIHVWLTVGR